MTGRLTAGRKAAVLAGELVVASARDDLEIIAHGLGSCVAVVLYDPACGVGGLLHALLPEGKADAAKARARPTTFADTGVHVLVRELLALGAKQGRFRIALAGGASQRQPARDHFRIGRRNVLAARRALFECGLLVDAEDVGGTTPRTVRLDLGSGRVSVNAAGATNELLGSSRRAGSSRGRP